MISRDVHAVEIASTPKIPQSSLSFPECQLGQFERRARDNPDHGCPNSVKHPLHPGQSSESHVGGREHQHHHERGQHERNSHRSRPKNPGANVTEINRQLSGQRTGRQLCQRQSLNIVFLADPLALIHKILLHVPGKRDWSAETYRTQPQEICGEPRKGNFSRLRR